ncbi:MAG TPA: hydroxymethylbilane synthase [Candidatus Limnocylindrales bacterium]|nr:hydroxymethylbilane synthase [Candidatus Limnocylindrales bacterium]
MSDGSAGEVIRIGTRGSALARIQADQVADGLRRAGHASRIVIVETAGDRRAPDTAWGEGAFVAAIERALLDGEVDVAVHSAKDVPTEMDGRLRIGAYLERADARDALVVRDGAPERGLADLPAGTRVGTDSPRRTAFVRARRPDLEVHPLHGNVDTRLRRLASGETDALILACAGLDRLGLGDRIAERFAPDVLPPAPGQGAIAVQLRRADDRTTELVAAIDHQPTRAAVEAERAFLEASGGGCRSPIGAYATIEAGQLELLGGRAAVDGSGAVTIRRSGPLGAGLELAASLAVELGQAAGRASRRVLITRTADQAGALLAALAAQGFVPVAVPTIEIRIEPAGAGLAAAVGRVQPSGWIVVTSTNGVRAIEAARAAGRPPPGAARWAVIGASTAAALRRLGIEPAFLPSEPDATRMAAELPLDGPVLVVRGDLAGTALADGLRHRGAPVDDVIAYRTIEAPASSRTALEEALDAGAFAAVVFSSGSTVRGLVQLAAALGVDLRSIPAICIGPATADAARAAGFTVLAVALTPEPDALATAVVTALGAVAKLPAVPVEA